MRNRLARALGVPLLIVAGLLMGGCFGPARAPEASAEAARPQAKSQSKAAPVAPRQTPKYEDYLLLHGGYVPEELRQTIEIRDYGFEVSDVGEKPNVRLKVFNLLDEESITFEIRTLFFREDGQLLDTTEWVRASAPPRKAYRYRAICFSELGVREQVQIRLLTSQSGTE